MIHIRLSLVHGCHLAVIVGMNLARYQLLSHMPQKLEIHEGFDKLSKLIQDCKDRPRLNTKLSPKEGISSANER